MTLQPAFAAELVQPLVCSAVSATALTGICSVTPVGNSHNDVKVELTAASAAIDVGGYKGHYRKLQWKLLRALAAALDRSGKLEEQAVSNKSLSGARLGLEPRRGREKGLGSIPRPASSPRNLSIFKSP
ncbi:hypothetical protein IVB15_00150 [Bradyrhizobium sp. 182]|uniref:hypothetical protein n=1 Tax=Bradyrhizobium sp. 182 TaxID=2782651 RepID=UPI001FF91A35|nr:hypothetical protein [Bradyrhizobium sp. 182]MCK1526216.1 hypothetical protein [Bradyrhizobium sp. 182]